jgi:hypothetical protein
LAESQLQGPGQKTNGPERQDRADRQEKRDIFLLSKFEKKEFFVVLKETSLNVCIKLSKTQFNKDPN